MTFNLLPEQVQQANIEVFKHSDFQTIKNSSNENVQIYGKLLSDGDYGLFCKSASKEQKETAMRSRAEQRLEEDIALLVKSVGVGKRKETIGIERQIGRIKEKHRAVAHYYTITYHRCSFDCHLKSDGAPGRLIQALDRLKSQIEQTKIGYAILRKEIEKLKTRYPLQMQEQIEWSITAPSLEVSPQSEKRDALCQTDGCYLLKTNRTDLNDEEIWQLYIMLTRVENAFKNLKSDLGLRPNDHQKEHRVDGHIFISILAYHLLHTIEYTLRNQGCHTSWSRINELLSNHTYVSIHLPLADGQTLHLRKPGIPEHVHRNIYEKLKIDLPKVSTQKLKV